MAVVAGELFHTVDVFDWVGFYRLVASGVSDRPSTLEETTRGAGHRARAAAACGGTVLGIGMESGLFDVGVFCNATFLIGHKLIKNAEKFVFVEGVPFGH